MTVLFTDVVGSTQLFGDLGPAAAEGARARHFASLRGALSVHRGREVKTLGDGLMAAFESATDALACAVTIQQATVSHNRRAADQGMELRIGVSAGEVTCEENDYFGSAVVEASRLCAAAGPGQILAADVVRILAGERASHTLEPFGALTLKGLPAPTVAWQVLWDMADEFGLRVAVAEDSVLLREGIVRLLEAESFDVVLQASDAETLLAGLESARPHVVMLDVRMPPTHTIEGLLAAERIRAEHPEIGIIVLSQAIQASAARRLLGGETDGVGYMLKERVADVTELASAIRTVARGGSAIDPTVVSRLAAQR